MGSFKINFKLQKLNKIKPFGEKGGYSLGWFGLTDGLLWISVGGQTNYAYGKEARKRFHHCKKYNDYYLARFLEDFFKTFRYVGEPIPEKLYDNVENFALRAEKWLDSYGDEADEIYEKFYAEEFFPLYEWYSQRSFDSAHLLGGPDIGCFRCENKIKIVWQSDYALNNGKSIWTAPHGCFELPYNDFVWAVEAFFEDFCAEMDIQTEKALKKNWKKLLVDKQKLVEENGSRRSEFLQCISLLKNNKTVTDWEKIIAIYQKMTEQV